MARNQGRHHIARRTKIATALLGLSIAVGGLVVSTTAGDSDSASADEADLSQFVDITTVEPNVDKPEPGDNASTGSFTVDCGKNENEHFNPDNFIAQPGVRNGAQHLHDYVGNLSTDADSDNESLEGAGTTCKNGDESTYFWPVVRIDQAEEGEEEQAAQENEQDQGNQEQGDQNQGNNQDQGDQNQGDQNQGDQNQGNDQDQQNNNDQGQNQDGKQKQGRNSGGGAQPGGGDRDGGGNGDNQRGGRNQGNDNDQNNNQGQNNQGQNNNDNQNNNEQNNNNNDQNQGDQNNNNDNNNQGNENQGNENQGNENQGQEEEQAELEEPNAENELAGNDGEIQQPKTVDITFNGSPVTKVEEMPKFLRILYGDAKVTTNGPENARPSWTCTGFEDRIIQQYVICPEGSDVKRVHTFASCLDGNNIDSENHRDHIQYPNEDGECADGLTAVPELTISLTYEIPREIQEAGQYKVDSFPEEDHNPFSDHDDFANVMSDEIMGRLVDCINEGQECRE